MYIWFVACNYDILPYGGMYLYQFTYPLFEGYLRFLMYALTKQNKTYQDTSFYILFEICNTAMAIYSEY